MESSNNLASKYLLNNYPAPLLKSNKTQVEVPRGSICKVFSFPLLEVRVKSSWSGGQGGARLARIRQWGVEWGGGVDTGTFALFLTDTRSDDRI